MTGTALLSPGFIPRALALPRSQNFAFLRSRGLQHIQRLAHARWTDYNVHDPGVTILELLCYGLTDLGLRADYPMRDLLAPSPLGSPVPAPVDFHLAHDVLVSKPVSFDDLRRILIDIPGVRNAWVERHRGVSYGLDEAHETLTGDAATAPDAIELNGLFDVYLEYEDFVTAPPARVTKSDVRAVAVERIYGNRNLCQDVLNVCDLVGEDVAICADIELRADADTEAVHAEILYRLHHHVSPSVPFHSLEEMLARGRTVDEIFDGPVLEHGFIDEDELKAIRRKCEIRASDVYQILMDVDGVVAVKSLKLVKPTDPPQLEDWILPLATDRFHVAVFDADASKLTFYKRGLPYLANRKVVRALFDQKKTADIEAKLKVPHRELPVPAGTWRDPGAYEPLQNELPGTYLVGRIHDPGTDPVRQAQSRQLKAYMMFFDQICANYLAQLSHVGDLFTWRDVGSRTYFTQQVTGIANFEDLDHARARGHASFLDALQTIVEMPALAERRRLTFLTHLAARFAEEFDEYTALMPSLRTLTWSAPGTAASAGARLIRHKRAFLEDYPAASAGRGTGFDWRHPDVAANIAGYQRRLYRLLDIEPVERRQLAGHRLDIIDTNPTGPPAWRFRMKDTLGAVTFRSIACATKSSIEALLDLALRLGGDRANYEPAGAAASYTLVQRCTGEPPHPLTEPIASAMLADAIAYFKQVAEAEGFHAIEHILLRRRTSADPFIPVQFEAEEECCPPVGDPYSFRVSIVLPSWSPRFRDMRFRHLVEDTVRLETPAHIYPRICWINHAQMQDLEVALWDWQARLAAMARQTAACDPAERVTRTGRLPLPTGGDVTQADRDYAASLDLLIGKLYRLTNVYPLAQLHDCDAVDGDIPQVTLGRTSLGTL